MIFNSHTSQSHRQGKVSIALVAAASALALMAGSASAQPAGSSSAGSTGGAVGSKSANSAAGNSSTANASQMARADSKMVTDIAQANMAEIATGQMALEKSQSADVKKFAQQMVDDHSAALKEVQTLASSKGVTLPDGPGVVHTAKATALKAMTGNTFDSQYIKRSGVGDHESTAALLQKTQKDAKDADVKALATKMLPTVQHHLMMARQMATNVAKK